MGSIIKIMIVDDDVTMRMATRRLLQTAGYEVLCAENGEEAVQMAHVHRPDLILMDVNMPGMGGFEAMRLIKNDADLAATSVVMVSGSRVDSDSQVHGLETGADGYITRPIPNRELLARVQAILRIKAAETAVRRKEKQLRDLVAINVDGIFVLDHDGYVLFANPAACKLLDRPIQAIEGQFFGIPVIVDEYAELGLLRPDGARRMVEMRVREMDWEDHPAYLAVFHDITDRKRIEDEIQQLNSELEARVAARTLELHQTQEKLVRQERLAVLGQLAGGVGHELRNPLAVINNAVFYLNLIQPEANEKIKEYLVMIQNEMHNAEKIINDLLDFAGIQSASLSNVRIYGLVAGVFKRFPVPEGISVTIDLPDNLPALYVDPRQVEQVLGNLVLNAYQAMPAGGKLTISATHSDQEISIAIQDTGVGIPPVNMPKLFDPLFTTKPKGIGLGLVVCKKLIEANGGQIEVESQVEQGATFRVVLPAAIET